MAVIGATNQELLPIVQRRPLKKVILTMIGCTLIVTHFFNRHHLPVWKNQFAWF